MLMYLMPVIMGGVIGCITNDLAIRINIRHIIFNRNFLFIFIRFIIIFHNSMNCFF